MESEVGHGELIKLKNKNVDYISHNVGIDDLDVYIWPNNCDPHL